MPHELQRKLKKYGLGELPETTGSGHLSEIVPAPCSVHGAFLIAIPDNSLFFIGIPSWKSNSSKEYHQRSSDKSGAFWAHNPECGLLGTPFDHMINHVAARFLQKRLTENVEVIVYYRQEAHIARGILLFSWYIVLFCQTRAMLRIRRVNYASGCFSR